MSENDGWVDIPKEFWQGMDPKEFKEIVYNGLNEKHWIRINELRDAAKKEDGPV